MINDRIGKLQKNLKTNQAIFLSTNSNIFYFANFNFLVPEEKEAFLLITKNNAFLFHASFNPVENYSFIKNLPSLKNLKINLNNIIKKNNINLIFFEPDSLTVNLYDLLKNFNTDLKKIDKNIIINLKIIKNNQEIKKIKQACQIAKKAFEILKPQIKINQSELEIKNLLENILFNLKSEKPAFPIIIAFGENSAIAHHQPTDKKLINNMPVLIDFGATHQKYRSDMTRTFWHGDNPDPEFLKIKKIVDQAYQAAREVYGLGTGAYVNTPLRVTAKDVDKMARDVIVKAGYGNNFDHTTGHGLGIDIHEAPSLNSHNETLITNNMVFTLEPGIYLKNKFGYRYENTVLVEDDKIVELTGAYR